MEIKLEKRPQKPVIIEAFPGIGLVGTIAAEFLIDHLKAKPIGRLRSEEAPALVAVHQGRILEPFGIYYDSKSNVVIVSALENVSGMEWKLAETIKQLCDMLKAKELICIEGFGAEMSKEPKAFYLTNDPKKRNKLEKIGLNEMREGIISKGTDDN